MGPLRKEIPQIELRSIWQIVRLRWWIVPICLFVSAGLMFAQESDLQYSPVSTTVSKIYGAKDETAGLASFGVDLAAIKEFPSFQNQLAIVHAEAPQLLLAVSEDLPLVWVSRAEPQVSMLAAADGDGKQVFTVSSNGAANYGFTCTAPKREQCDQSIDVYVQKVEDERRVAITTGLLQLETQIQSVLAMSKSDQFALQLQVDAIEQSSGLITGELAFVSETFETSGGTISTVKVSTYLFGLSVGLVVAFLIMLQLTATDNKIRSVKRLQSELASVNVLGELHYDNMATAPTSIAASIVVEARKHKITKVVLVPVGHDFASGQILQSLQSPELSSYIELSNGSRIRSMSLSDLVESSVGYVLVIQKNLTTSDELDEAFQTLSGSENLLLGTVLSDL